MASEKNRTTPGGAREETVAQARAKLDQVREEAGMPLRGDELAARRAPTPSRGEDLNGDPPLDWRMTPRNIALQLGAIALFVAVCWFLIQLATDGIRALIT
ncbi:MAG: hypothetical protein AAFR16_12025 [Pseudomonadota bacterium]